MTNTRKRVGRSRTGLAAVKKSVKKVGNSRKKVSAGWRADKWR